VSGENDTPDPCNSRYGVAILGVSGMPCSTSNASQREQKSSCFWFFSTGSAGFMAIANELCTCMGRHRVLQVEMQRKAYAWKLSMAKELFSSLWVDTTGLQNLGW